MMVSNVLAQHRKAGPRSYETEQDQQLREYDEYLMSLLERDQMQPGGVEMMSGPSNTLVIDPDAMLEHQNALAARRPQRSRRPF